MKKIFITALAFAALVACNDSGKSSGDTAKKEEPKSAGSNPEDNPDYQKGLELIGKSDCFTCHKIDDRLNGPSYREVAAKYGSEGASVVPKLAEKIIKGGQGVWGTVAMTAHPDLSQADAEAMVKYILLLKN